MKRRKISPGGLIHEFFQNSICAKMYKNQWKKLVTFMLIVCLLFNSIVAAGVKDVKAEQRIGESTDSDMSEEYDVKLIYDVTGTWDGHSNVEVKLTNILDEKIEDWEIKIPADFEIENIWNAKVVSEQDNEYIIHNADWNQDIDVKGSVSFGMTVQSDAKIKLPEYCTVNRICISVEEENYKLEYTEYSNWDDKVNGKITITNTSDKRIEDWSLMLDGNFQIESIWNAAITESFEEEDEQDTYYYDLENAVYNQNIEAGQSVEFGFIAKCRDKLEITNHELFEMGMISEDYMEEDLEDEPDYGDDEFIYDADFFDSLEEYYAYLDSIMPKKKSSAKSRALVTVPEITPRPTPALTLTPTTMPTATLAPNPVMTSDPTLTPAPTLIPTPTPISATLKHDLLFDKIDVNVQVQNYIPLSNGIYTMQLNGDNVVLRKGKLKENNYDSFEKQVDMIGFAHGDTFEQFFVKGKEYYLLSGNVSKGKCFGRDLVVMPKKRFDKFVKEKDFKFKKNSKMYLQMSKLAYANKSGRNNGRSVTRVAGALTADGSTLVMWKQLTEKNGKRMELSLYDMKKIRKIIGDKFEKTLSFGGKLKKELKKACIGSIQKHYNKGDESKRLLHPHGSFQSLDIEKNGGGWRIYITSGDEGVNIPVTITRIDIQQKGKSIQYNAFQEFVSIPALLGQNDSNILKFELEGCHVVGENLDFGVVSRNGTEVKQYIAYVPLSAVQRPLSEK